MPTVDPPTGYEQAADFSSVISTHLTALQSGLSLSCERLATERETSLQEENKQLQKENKELRLRLQGAGNQDQKDLDEATLLVTKPSEKSTKSTDIVPKHSSTGLVTNHDVSFKLLPEYLADDWVEGVNDVDSLGDGKFFQWMEETDPQKLITATAKSMVIDPSSSRRLFWDMVGIPILSWDLITIPLGVFSMGALGDEVMAGAGWVTLIYWTIDLPFTFLTGFFNDDGDLIMDMRSIAKQYLKGFFGLDLVIILADWISVFVGILGSSAGALENMSILRIFRITRFVRLLRLRKLKQKIQTIEDSVSSEWVLVIMNLCGKIFTILMLNHYIGCVWVLIGQSEFIDVPSRRWLTSVPYPQYDSNGGKMDESEWAYQYLTSLHWAVAQFTPGPQNIQPQNCLERVFAVFVLLFGLVIFSSFIAGVTQARMQLSKMMSKLDRDLWLLRKFCQQHQISRELTGRMKRYIDLVIVPNFHKLNTADVVLLPKLSAHLRSQLNKELVSQILCIHPFFVQIRTAHDAVMNTVSNSCIENMSLARGDVAFGSGQIARFMLLVSSGILDFIALGHQDNPEQVNKGRWVAEAVLWTKWIHQGQMQASIESTAMLVDSQKLRAELVKNGPVMGFVRKYGAEFIHRLNLMAEVAGGVPGDTHDNIAKDIDIGATTNRCAFLWKAF